MRTTRVCQHESVTGAAPRTAALDLPPAFSALRLDRPQDVFAGACDIAEEDRPGTLAWAQNPCVLAFAVVLAPDEPLHTARRVFLAGMNALAAAIGSCAPPEKPVTFDWPDAVRFDGGRIGGGRLGFPDTCREEAVPHWLVFAASIIASKRHAGDPGRTPDTTSLEEEGFAPGCGAALVGNFARNFLTELDVWADASFGAIAKRYLRLLSDGHTRSIDENGDLILGDPDRAPERRPLAPALRLPAWLDPATGAPRL